MCGEKMCWDCEEYVDPNKHRCCMKPIVNQEEDSGEAQSKPNKQIKGQRKRTRISEIISHKVEEEDTKEEDGQEY